MIGRDQQRRKFEKKHFFSGGGGAGIYPRGWNLQNKILDMCLRGDQKCN